MKSYCDRVKFYENATEITFRNGSIEKNHLRASVVGIRACVDGCWYIESYQDASRINKVDLNRVYQEALSKALAIAKRNPRVCPGIVEVNNYQGTFTLGKPDFDENSVEDIVVNYCEEVQAYGVTRCEITILFRDIHRVIESIHGERAEERKFVYEVTAALSIKSLNGRIGFGSKQVHVVAGIVPLEKAVEFVVGEALNRARASLQSKALNPLYVGKYPIVLDPEACSALFHEISHALDAEAMLTIAKGSRIGSPELEVYDDPLTPYSPAARAFDDEGVASKRRMLIEGGVVVDHHHTRKTAYLYGSDPGSAYGLFRPPQAFHTQLVVKEGDWKRSEILEETKKGFAVYGIVMAVLERGYIRLMPEYARRIEGGEEKDFIYVRAVKIPLNRIKTIDAISREQMVRTSIENDRIIAEVSPYIRIEGFVE